MWFGANMAGRRNKIAFKFALHCCIIKTTFGGVSTDRNLHQEPDSNDTTFYSIVNRPANTDCRKKKSARIIFPRILTRGL